jgi:GGDEF domain-containing protein
MTQVEADQNQPQRVAQA